MPQNYLNYDMNRPPYYSGNYDPRSNYQSNFNNQVNFQNQRNMGQIPNNFGPYGNPNNFRTSYPS